MDWFLYDKGLPHERVMQNLFLAVMSYFVDIFNVYLQCTYKEN